MPPVLLPKDTLPPSKSSYLTELPRAHMYAALVYGSQSCEMKQHNGWEAAFVTLCIYYIMSMCVHPAKLKEYLFYLKDLFFLSFLCNVEVTAEK